MIEWDLEEDILEYERNHEAWRRVEQAALRALETKYSDRGLRFDKGGWGLLPAQIYGTIDGKRFYWRLRGNTSSLSVGPVNKALIDLSFEEGEKRKAENLAEHQGEADYEATHIDGASCLTCFIYAPKAKPEFTEYQYYPTQVTDYSEVSPVVEGDDWKGDIRPDEAGPLFGKLLEGLIPVEVDQQLSYFNLLLIAEKENLPNMRELWLNTPMKGSEEETEVRHKLTLVARDSGFLVD